MIVKYCLLFWNITCFGNIIEIKEKYQNKNILEKGVSYCCEMALAQKRKSWNIMDIIVIYC